LENWRIGAGIWRHYFGRDMLEPTSWLLNSIAFGLTLLLTISKILATLIRNPIYYISDNKPDLLSSLEIFVISLSLNYFNINHNKFQSLLMFIAILIFLRPKRNQFSVLRRYTKHYVDYWRFQHTLSSVGTFQIQCEFIMNDLMEL